MAEHACNTLLLPPATPIPNHKSAYHLLKVELAVSNTTCTGNFLKIATKIINSISLCFCTKYEFCASKMKIMHDIKQRS